MQKRNDSKFYENLLGGVEKKRRPGGFQYIQKELYPGRKCPMKYDGHYEKVDWAAAGLELDPRPDGRLHCRAYT